MADLNTKIRGEQIKDASITEDELNSSVAGNGIAGGAGVALAVELDGSTLAVGASGVKLANLTDANILVGNASNVATGVAMSGDATIANTGALTIGADKVDNTKLANITRGSVKVGGVADAPTDLAAKTDGYILIGDGTDVGSVAVSGDVTITNAGVVTIGNDKVSNAKLANMTQGTVKVGGAASAPTDLDAKTDGYILVGDGTDVNSVAVSGDVALTNAGVTTVTDLTISGEVAGDLLYFDGTNWIRLADSASSGYVLTSDAAGGLSWTAKSTVAEDYVQETEIKFEDESANANGATTAFSLAVSPVTNSVQVFLNGLLQQEGSGKDYTLSGTTVTFATAPATGDSLLIHYIAT